MTLIRPELPKLGFPQLMSSWVGILATPVIFFTMAVGFPHNVSRFLGMKKVTKRDYWVLIGIVWLFTGIPIMLDCSSNGLVARVLYGPGLLKIEPWKGDLAAPFLAHALGGPWMLAAYTAGLFSAALSTLAGMVFIMSANVTRDVIKLWWPQISDKSMLYLGYFLIALFLFLPFYWTLVRPPELLSIFMGLGGHGPRRGLLLRHRHLLLLETGDEMGRYRMRRLGHRLHPLRRLFGALSKRCTAWEAMSGSSS